MTVWIDSEQARIFHFDAEHFDEATVRTPTHHVHRHPKDQETRPRSEENDEHRFFRDVAVPLADAKAILLVGPSMTKLHFLRYLHTQSPKLEACVVGVESADHPTDPQIVAHARAYFHTPAPRRPL